MSKRYNIINDFSETCNLVVKDKCIDMLNKKPVLELESFLNKHKASVIIEDGKIVDVIYD